MAHQNRTFTTGTRYFFEFDRDGAAAVLTVRTTSFSGPIYVVQEQNGLNDAQNVGEFFWLGTSSGVQTTAVDDVSGRAVRPTLKDCVPMRDRGACCV